MAIDPIAAFDIAIYLHEEVIIELRGLLKIREIDIWHFDGCLESWVHEGH